MVFILMVNIISLDYYIDLGACKFIPLEFIKYKLDSVLMFMSAIYRVCMHTFHSADICIVCNSVKCVHYFYNQVNSLIIIYFSHCLNLQSIS